MKVTICIGSACHLKGSREIIEKLQQLVAQNGLSGKVDLNGSAAATVTTVSASRWRTSCFH